MTKSEKRRWVTKLKKYWNRRDVALSAFHKIEGFIESEMYKELGEKLEFFYGDMHEGCLGIGHTDYDRRDSKKRGYFPLFQEHELRGI